MTLQELNVLSRLGQWVRSRRRRRGMTQAVLAGLVGRSERWMVQVERGAVDVRVSDLVGICAVLGVDVRDLVVEAAGPQRGRRAGRGRPAHPPTRRPSRGRSPKPG
jgi:transcriptional regulator with XRE-family HTH domain